MLYAYIVRVTRFAAGRDRILEALVVAASGVEGLFLSDNLL